MKKSVFILNLLFILLAASVSVAQDVDPRTEGQFMDYTNLSMPESPTAFAFNAVSEIQVNHAKGVPAISIPIYTYELDGVQVPIALTYDASGIKVSQMATAVGLGWSLDAGGQISRTVRSRPDEEYTNGWFYEGYIREEYYNDKDPRDISWQEYMKGTIYNNYDGLVKRRDHNPDLFSYSFLGYSGTYIHTTDINIVKEQQDGITLVPFGNNDDSLYAEDLAGNFYVFDYNDSEKSNNELIFHDGLENLESYQWEDSNGTPRTTAWKLSKITTKNDKEIHIDYQNVSTTYINQEGASHITVGKACNLEPTGNTARKINTIYDYNTQLVKKISSPESNIQVLFYYESDTGLPEDVWNTKLTKITIKDIQSQDKKDFFFEYTRFAGDPRLKLERIREVAYTNGNPLPNPPYVFDYNNESLPPKDSKAQDLYGYYNKANTNAGLIPDFFTPPVADQPFFNAHAGDRSLDSNGLKTGILTQITYPTGGKSHLFYEPNVADRLTLKGYCGGLRVREIKNTDAGMQTSRKVFLYDDLIGEDLQAQSARWLQKTEGNSITFFSSPMRMPGDWAGYKTGYFYGKVIEMSYNENAEAFKVEYRYTENFKNNQRYDPLERSMTVFKGTSAPLKIVEYQYELISDTGAEETVEWTVVDDMDCFVYLPVGTGTGIGYTTNIRKIRFTGNYAYLPTRIATTEFLKNNTTTTPVTVIKDVTYDPNTLLKKQEITDLRYKRQENTQGEVSYVINDTKAERITVDYTYPSDVHDFDHLTNFPKATIIKQEVTTAKDAVASQTGGQAYAFDDKGNIKTVYAFEKDQGSNTATLSYIPTHYEEQSVFTYQNGFPVQVRDPMGFAPTTYVWSQTRNVPVAKIEGIRRSSINQQVLQEVEQADYSQLPAKLDALRNHPSVTAHQTMMTTFTYKPLAGVETITDPKGETRTYQYDDFGRLIRVLDNDNNIVNENEYHYALE